EGRLTGARDELVVGELGGRGEDLRVGPVAHPGAGAPARRLADDGELARVGEGREGRLGAGAVAVVVGARLAAVEGHPVGLAAAVDLDVQTRGERVDDGGTDAVQAAGGGVGAAAELAAGVKLGEDDLDAA